MPQNYYPSDEEDDSPASPEQSKGDSKENTSQTALLDKAVFPEEPKVDDICKFRVVAVNDKDVEVEYVEEEKGEKPSNKKPSSMSDADSMIDNMAQQNSEGGNGGGMY